MEDWAPSDFAQIALLARRISETSPQCETRRADAWDTQRRRERLAQEFAALKGLTTTRAVELALENELRRIEDEWRPLERLRPIADRVAARPPAGLDADKAFHDRRCGDARLLSRFRLRRHLTREACCEALGAAPRALPAIPIDS